MRDRLIDVGLQLLGCYIEAVFVKVDMQLNMSKEPSDEAVTTAAATTAANFSLKEHSGELLFFPVK